VLVLFTRHLVVKRCRTRVLARPESNTLPLISDDFLLEGAVPSDRREIGCASCE